MDTPPDYTQIIENVIKTRNKYADILKDYYRANIPGISDDMIVQIVSQIADFRIIVSLLSQANEAGSVPMTASESIAFGICQSWKDSVRVAAGDAILNAVLNTPDSDLENNINLE